MNRPTRTINVATTSAMLGALLLKHRMSLNRVQKDIYEATNISKSTWSRIENGISPVSLDDLKRIADCFETTRKVLMEDLDQSIEFAEAQGFKIEPIVCSSNHLAEQLAKDFDEKKSKFEPLENIIYIPVSGYALISVIDTAQKAKYNAEKYNAQDSFYLRQSPN